jgi:hypothetical protein
MHFYAFLAKFFIGEKNIWSKDCREIHIKDAYAFPASVTVFETTQKRCYVHILDISNAIIENDLREKSRIGKTETKKGSLYYL